MIWRNHSTVFLVVNTFNRSLFICYIYHLNVLNPYNGRVDVLALRSGENSFIPYWRALKALRGQAAPGRPRCIAVADYATRRVKFNVTESTSAANTFHAPTHMNTRTHTNAHSELPRYPNNRLTRYSPLSTLPGIIRENAIFLCTRRGGSRWNGICAQGHGKVKSLFSNSQRHMLHNDAAMLFLVNPIENCSIAWRNVVIESAQIIESIVTLEHDMNGFRLFASYDESLHT